MVSSGSGAATFMDFHYKNCVHACPWPGQARSTVKPNTMGITALLGFLSETNMRLDWG